MRETIIKFLNEQNGKRFSIADLAEALGYKGSDTYKDLAKTVNAMEDEALIVPNRKNQYTLIKFTKHYTGVLDLKAKGFAFLKTDDERDDDIYIAPPNVKDAMNKDRVLVFVKKSPKGFKKEGIVERVLKRNYTHLIGTVIKRGPNYFLISDDKGVRSDVRINPEHLNGAKPHDKVRAEIINYKFRSQMLCKVTDVIGHMNKPGVDILSKILSHDIDPAFPTEVLEAAKQFRDLGNDYGNRRDLRDHNIFTIDGADAKDYDDAVEITRLDNGNYRLGVHIADVSHYVQENSVLDKEAYERGTSIYLVDRVIPMLPEHLSNNLCSLMPGVDRFAMSCVMEIDAEGRVKNHEIFESVIKSQARMTYTQVNAMLEGDDSLNKEYSHIAESVKHMSTLAEILRHHRTQRGSLHFETNEPVITLDEQGRAKDVKLLDRGQSERIVEEFMLIANQTVAEHVFWMELPFIYRVHEAPKEEKLNQLLTMANALGFRIKGNKQIEHKELQKLLKKVEDTASEIGINTMMLRSMQKAIYSEHNLGHFGLAFTHYTHFTSPIRRYPDLMVHRLMRTYIINGNIKGDTIGHYREVMPSVASQTSALERVAITLERDILDMKKAEYMASRINEVHEGHISSVTNFGIYITLDNAIEGLVHISELGDDYYVFNEDLLMLIGERTRKIYRMGDTVKVKVEGVNIAEGQVDFTIAKE